MYDLKYDQKIDLKDLINIKKDMDLFLKEIKNLIANNFKHEIK